MSSELDQGVDRSRVGERKFVAYADYVAPPLTAEVATRRLFGWLWRQFDPPENAETFVAPELLRVASRRRLNQIAAPPACGPLLDDLDETFASWLADADRDSTRQLVLLPPGDANGLLRAWADETELCMLTPPTREELFTQAGLEHVDRQVGHLREAESVCVVPQLEDWFLRCSGGLACIRRLLRGLADRERPVIVGCNTWAWSLLVKAVRADLYFKTPLTFAPFSQHRLADWFEELSEHGAGIVFRMASTGQTIIDPDDESASPAGYFEKLAAESFGIPWVAWSRWRKSLRHTREQTELPAPPDNGPDPTTERRRTLWVEPMGELMLPLGYETPAAFYLHALVIHGKLTAGELDRVCPSVGDEDILQGLMNVGMVQQTDEHWSIEPAAYPDIRRNLGSAGFDEPRL